MSDLTYYVKNGNKYVPVGMSGPSLYEGLWLVKIEPGRKSSTNIYVRLCDLPDCHDLQILAKATLLEDIITKVMTDAWADGKSTSIYDVAAKITAAIATAESKLTSKHLRGL